MQAADWNRPLEALYQELGSGREGLSSAEARSRLEQFGANELDFARRSPLIESALAEMKNPLAWLLIFAAVVSAAAGETADAIVVVATLFLSSLVSILQSRRTAIGIARLRSRIAHRSHVLRDGAVCELPSRELVAGDVIELSAGSLVPADAVLIEARDLFVNEAVLTGESYPIEKRPGAASADAPLSDRENMVHLGTNVQSGFCRALIVTVGRDTAFGAIAGRLVLRAPETEFERGLKRFGGLLFRTMMVLVLFVVAAGMLQRHAPIESMLFAIALAVGIAPEMLPAVLATMLARGARRMEKQGVLVRRLGAIENLGNMDVLCTDKTGTLTEGTIELASALDVEGRPAPRVLELARWNAALQSGLTNPLDRAILAAAEAPSPPLPSKLDELPFDFMRRRLSVLVRSAEGPLLVSKGAFENILEACTSCDRDGRVTPLDDKTRAELRARVAAICADGFRVVGVATRGFQEAASITRADEVELSLQGLLTFRDPPKAGAAAVIAELAELGLTVKIISGDHRAVVAHLARELELNDGSMITGPELSRMPVEALWNAAERTALFAEVDPTQKERILLALKKTGHVVGFMGDGINDAPALHAADVGISVDTAVDVAREAADFVLLERELETVKSGVLEGRRTFANTIKYVLTTESANLGNMLSMAAASMFLPFLPLLAQQILLNNFLSDVPAMALSQDRVDGELLQRPRRWDMRYIRRFMIVFGGLSAVFDALTFVILRAGFAADPSSFRTAWFVESLLTELAVLFALRTERPFWKSRPHNALLATSAGVAAIALALPWTKAFGFVPLPWTLLGAVLAITACYVLIVEKLKRPLSSWMRGR